MQEQSTAVMHFGNAMRADPALQLVFVNHVQHVQGSWFTVRMSA